MPHGIVRISSPSRLHFGLLAFGQPSGRQYGGVGLMLDRPRVELSVSAASHFSARGFAIERVKRLTRRWADARQQGVMPGCQIRVEELPPWHVGLGSGTQLALSVARGLDEFHGRPAVEPSELALIMGRGKRSAIGTFGFASGGLVSDPGKVAGEPIAPFAQQISAPAAWRYVLIQLRESDGLSGETETTAFQEMDMVPLAVTGQLEEELHDRLVPSFKAGDYLNFSESVYRYGKLAGGCFAQFQAGAFASPRIGELVEYVRELGVPGVGQSSWGPTIFAVTQGTREADRLVARLADYYGDVIEGIRVSAADTRGAVIRREVGAEQRATT